MTDTPLTDDYVASILSRDAQRSSQNRYVASGLGSLLSRPRGNAPKPNTRFLRNIVKEADSHNAALRRKEEEESRARLRDLKKDLAGGSSRRHRSRSKDRSRRDDNERSSRVDKSTRRRSRDRNQRREKKRHRSRSRSRSPRRDHSERKEYPREQRRSRHKDEQHDDTDPAAEDSDPLESVIGPKPPPKTLPRGRGAYKDSSINTRFDPSYDPKADVDPDVEDDDWDMALEAIRDRAKWRKSGAERLRAAGFTDEEVANWEKGGGGKREGEEKDISDVRWRKKGESREWDRGKVVTGDGEGFDVKAEWGRLKDT